MSPILKYKKKKSELQLNLVLSVSDISGSGYEGEPGSADRLWVPQRRLLKLIEVIAYDRTVKVTADFSEVRRMDHDVVFFDGRRIW